jgi:hypothetical protein
MIKHYYAFGSVCRGEVDAGSDIDLLACVSHKNLELDSERFSIYTHDRVREIWHQGNPFAWHLHFESKLLFSSNGEDFIKILGEPSPYNEITKDCKKFYALFCESLAAIKYSNNSTVFHLSCMFLAVRNFSTCFSFLKGKPIFSRNSPLLLDSPLCISVEEFSILSRSRILSTRGHGISLTEKEISDAVACTPIILGWMVRLLNEVSS